MKVKIIQILLGAVGSVIAVLVSHLAGGNPDVVAATAGGIALNGVFGDLVSRAVEV